jgi:hypothetical protein
MKFYKAYGASTEARIMSSKEIDQLAAQSLRKTVPSVNVPVVPANHVTSKPIVKPVAEPLTKPVAKKRTPFEHLKANLSSNKQGQRRELFAHLKEG